MKKHGFMGLLLCMVFAIFISPLSVYAAYGQNGDNTIADTETYSRVTEKISDYAAAHEMQVDSSLLTYAYRLFDMAQLKTEGTTAEGEYTTFLMAADEFAAVGYFTCTDGETQDCTYTALHSQVFLDAMYHEKVYRLYSAKDCLIEGKQYDLVMDCEGKLYDLRDDTVISDQSLDSLDI